MPDGMGGSMAGCLTAKAGGLADVSAALVSALFRRGADVYVALPDYRSMFGAQMEPLIKRQWNTLRMRVPNERVHLAQDCAFFYRNHIYSSDGWKNTKLSLAFQREVINNIIPLVQPDLIHCNDWMTGLIPAVARSWGIPCLFTLHNLHTVKCFSAYIEDRGIDAASFWQHLWYERMPVSYAESRETNPVDFITSGVFASHFVNTVSPTFLMEVVEGRHGFVEPQLRQELANKWHSGCALGILNAPDPSFNPRTDGALVCNYSSRNHAVGKQKNKLSLQERLGLIQDGRAPLFFWPSRLDPNQKGYQLLADILFEVVSRYRSQKLQVVFVADGEFKRHFDDIVRHHDLRDRVALCPFDEQMERLAYGASDFVLMPSLFEPCGLPQMIGPIYGALPVARKTGGICDTVSTLRADAGSGNGFLFGHYHAPGLLWVIGKAMDFYSLAPKVRGRQVARIMEESAAGFNHEVMARQYIGLYERMLNRPLIVAGNEPTLESTAWSKKSPPSPRRLRLNYAATAL